MKIGIDISQAVYKGTGVGRFVEGLIKAICTYDESNEWIFFFSSLRLNLKKELEQLIQQKGFKLLKFRFPNSLLSSLWNDLHVLNIDSFTGNLDLFITSDWVEPPSKSKKATVIHDLSVFRFPETVDKKILETQKKRLRWVEKESSIIFTDSESTRKDVLKFFPNIKSSVFTIYPGVDVNSSKKSVDIFNRLKIKKDFMLTVGKLEPRKNLKRLLEAFEKAKTSNIDLVIVGEYGWGEKITPNKNVKVLGYVDEETLSSLYKSCLFFIYPSLWEGFGYPVVEAMKHRAAVATSDTSSLKEIAEGYGLLFNPTDVDDIVQTIKLLSTNKKLRDELKRKSLKRATDFTWKKYYSEMINVLKEL